MEQAIEVATVEEQSFNSALSLALYKPITTKSEATPMKLGSADVVCLNCGKRGRMMARCYAKPGAMQERLAERPPTRRAMRGIHVHDARDLHRPLKVR